MDDLHTLTATQAARLIQAGKLTPSDLTDSCLARIAEREPQVRAFHYHDPDQARKQAANARPGPLHGIPIGVEDVLDTADMPSGYGSPIWDGWRPSRWSRGPVAPRSRRAGRSETGGWMPA